MAGGKLKAVVTDYILDSVAVVMKTRGSGKPGFGCELMAAKSQGSPSNR